MTQLHSLRLGFAQIQNSYDYGSNFQSIGHAIETLSLKKADLIFFPECATTGYNRGLLKIDAEKLLTMVEQIKALAKKYSVYLALPTPWPSPLGGFTNSLLIINSQGETEQQFDKIGFQNGEDKLFVAGTPHSRTFEFKGHKLAVIICFEMEQNPTLYLDSDEKYDFIFWPGFYATENGETWEHPINESELKTKNRMTELKTPVVRLTCASSPESSHWPTKKFGGSVVLDKNCANIFTAELEEENQFILELKGRDIVAISRC